MKTIKMEKLLKAKPELVWELIVDPVHYQQWTKAFAGGSAVEGSWQVGSQLKFFDASADDGVHGMVARVEAIDWPRHVALLHIGLLVNNQLDDQSPMAKQWTPAYEKYDLKPTEEGCLFTLTQDVPAEYADELSQSWVAAFELMEEQLETSTTVGKVITITETSSSDVETIWQRLVDPELVKTWNFASDDWYCPTATNELAVGKEFHYQMAAKDNSMQFDFWGTYDVIEPGKFLAFHLGDDRKVTIQLTPTPNGCLITESFEAETTNNLDLQRQGWQSILHNLAN